MQKTKLSYQLIVGVMISLALVALSGQLLQARERRVRTTSLERAVCVGSGPGRWSDNELNVAIGRSVYRSQMSLNPSNGSASVTCRIRDENDPQPRFKTLDLGLGMLDTDVGSPAAIVNIYLNGQQAATQTITPGQAASLSLDVTNVNNVAIEATCSNKSAYCSRVYIFRARLERIPERR